MYLQTLLNALRHESDAVKKLIGLVLTLETADIFIHRPVKEVLWGYTDPLLKVAKTFDKSWFYTDWVGYFINVSVGETIQCITYNLRY